MAKRKTNEDDIENVLRGQIPEYEEQHQEPTMHEDSSVGQRISVGAQNNTIDRNAFEEFEAKVGASKLGENINKVAEVRDGWITVDRKLLGERSRFYPEDWVFMVRPATVEAIRNWSMIEENNGNSINDVFNEILKYCVSIKSITGTVSWQSICVWDKFFFVLLVREYTFNKGEANIEFYDDCANCDAPVKFKLESQALMFDMPDEDLYAMYDSTKRVWQIDPEEYDIEMNPITFYLPTVEKDINIKSWIINEYNENDKKNFDNVFIKFLPWLVPKVSKDMNIARQQIRKAESVFRSWDTEKFTFINDVIRNISVVPKIDISAICEKCGEEVTTRLRFPDGVSALFNVVNKHKKFGTK